MTRPLIAAVIVVGAMLCSTTAFAFHTVFDFAVDRGRLYFPISDRQGDVYVAELTRQP